MPNKQLLEQLEKTQMPSFGSSASTTGSDASDRDAIDAWSINSSDTEAITSDEIDIKIARDDLFKKNKALAQMCVRPTIMPEAKAVDIMAMAQPSFATNTKANADEIKIGKDDLFQKGKARAQMSSVTESCTTETKADEIKVAKDDFVQQEQATAQISLVTKVKMNEAKVADEIKVTTGDLFGKQKARAQTLSSALAGEIKITKNDLFQKDKVRFQYASASAPTTYKSADVITVSNDDLFANQKAKARTSTVTRAIVHEGSKDQMQVATEDLLHEELAKVQTSSMVTASCAEEILVAKGDLFHKDKAWAFATPKLTKVDSRPDEIKIATDDLFLKSHARIQSVPKTHAAKTEASTSEIRVATDDLFQKQKGRAQAYPVEAVAEACGGADLFQVQKSRMHAYAPAKLQNTKAEEITVAPGDLFQKEKAKVRDESAKENAIPINL